MKRQQAELHGVSEPGGKGLSSKRRNTKKGQMRSSRDYCDQCLFVKGPRLGLLALFPSVSASVVFSPTAPLPRLPQGPSTSDTGILMLNALSRGGGGGGGGPVSRLTTSQLLQNVFALGDCE